MKALLIILIIFATPEYERGWQDGYVDGHHYKYNIVIDSIPSAPRCDTCNYMDGYKAGRRKGYEDVLKIKTK